LLLRAAATFLRTRRFDDLAELVRHPDLDLAPDGVAHWQTLLDAYLTEHVQARVTARWFGRHAASLKAVYDNLIASVCRQEERALVTLDSDFADIRTYRPADYSGLLVLRLHKYSAPEVIRVVRRLLDVLKATDCRGQLWIVEHDRVRVRR
jgi:predicted nuclease of predicted toxin-antitoxin system